MARLADIDIVNSNGQLQLRFSATIVNVGQGPFELNASRPDTASPFSVVQKLYGSGGSADVSVPGASLIWGGDGIATGTSATWRRTSWSGSTTARRSGRA